MSVGFVVSERAPLAATGRWLVSGVLRNLIFDVAWQADVIVIDAPPGTGEEIQVMVRELPLSGALFVTTPQDLAQMDAERTLSHLREHGVPVIGMVQNMASLTCPHCAQAIDLYSLSKRLEDAGVPVLGRIPFDTRLSVTADTGCRWCWAIRAARSRSNSRASAVPCGAGWPSATRRSARPPSAASYERRRAR